MPDIRAVHTLSGRVASAKDALRGALYRAGYDPQTLDALPDPADCPPPLAAAIQEWQAAHDLLDAAYARTSGWRF